MEIEIGIDEHLIKTNQGKKESLNLNITIKFCDLPIFPEKNWRDFSDILQYWFSQLTKMKNGAEKGEFIFMNGPIALKLVRDKDEISMFQYYEDKLELEVKEKITLDSLLSKVVGAINKAIEIFESQNYDQEMIDKYKFSIHLYGRDSRVIK